ncbi:MAG: NADH-quinone oxidoreductase subunit F [Oscillospiraceae bacterium]|nr:NADH-quinone oxidoreductase subunit F [Oscillospiraceae bacterium]
MAKTVSFISRNWDKYDPTSLASYESIGGFSALKRVLDGFDIVARLTEADVQGRGGAAYPMGKKWDQARAVKGEHKVNVCNADEGEPCTFKDRNIISHDPFQMLEGMIICGYTVGAQDGYIYLREEYKHLRPLLLSAIDQCEKAGYLGDNIQGKEGFNYRIHLYSGAGAYVCGEGTALVESIEGKSGRPRMKPPFMKQNGLFYLPTCVNNVESYSIVPGLVMDGEGFYKSQGTPECPGTKMVSVGGNVKHPGVFEVPFGVTIRDLIDLAGGVLDGHEIRLVQLGGASGKIATPDQLDTLYTYGDMRKADLTPIGSGAVLVIDDRTSVIDFLRMTQEFFCHESCGQCTPCREGNRHIKLILDRVAEGTHTETDMEKLKKYADIMTQASLCGLGTSAQSALLTALKKFPEAFAIKS